MAFSNSRAEWIKSNNGAKEIEITIISSTPSSTVIEFPINGFEYEDITLNGESCYHVSLTGAIPMMVKGYPMLPNIRKSILIPDMAGMNYKIIVSEKTTVDVSTLLPSKGHLKRNINPADVPLTFSELYTSDTLFPKNTIELDEPNIVRDLRGQTIEYHPFRYNATRGKLEVTTKIRIEVFKDASVQAVNPFVRTNSFEGVSREFEGVYNTLFVYNGQGNIEYLPIPEPGRMLIIYYQDYADEIIPYYEWKLAKGMPTVKAEYPSET